MATDGRTLSHEALEVIRQIAVRRVVEGGEKPSKVIESFGLCRTTIYKWLAAHKKGGDEALASTKGTGRPPALTNRQKKRIREWICGKTPGQYGFDFGLWTRQAVQQMILDRFKKKLSLATVGRILDELEITPQKPLRRAYERDPAAIERWKTEEFPRLRARAKRRGADIFFLDEAGIRSDAPLQRTWAPRGETPIVPTSGRRQSVSAISAVNLQGAFWYDVYDGRLNAARFIEFLRAFLRTRRRPVFLVVDGHPAHRAATVSAYVQKTAGRLELHFLPGYAPDLNPDEFVWNDLRQRGVSKKPLLKNESLKARVVEDLAAIKADRDRVRSYFRAESVSYIMN